MTWKKLYLPGQNLSYFAIVLELQVKVVREFPVTWMICQSLFRAAGLKQVFHWVIFDLPADFFEKEIYFWCLGVRSTNLEERNGIMGRRNYVLSLPWNIPFLVFEVITRPGEEIAEKIEDWDKRSLSVFGWKRPQNGDIGALSCIPFMDRN